MAAWLERLAQAPDVHVYRTLLDVHMVAPDVIEQLRARIDAPRMRHEEVQQPELGGREIKALLAGADAVSRRVEAQPIDLYGVARELRRALDAFARLDCNVAAEVIRQDAAIDAEFQSVLRQLVTYMMEDPRTISPSLDLLFVAKAIERIGDHAKNIAEFIIYVVKGADVRHSSMEHIELAIK